MNAKEYAMGMKDEAEHTHDKQLLQKIVRQHLAHDPNYYSKIKSVLNKESFYTGFIKAAKEQGLTDEQTKGLVKVALRVEETPKWNPNRMLANTVGRLGGIRPAILVGQEKAHKYLQNPNTKELEKHLSDLKGVKELSNTLVRTQGSRPIKDLQRVWQNHRTGDFSKVLGTLATPIIDLQANLSRSNHYNPFSDTASIYSDIPEITRHEVGHAETFNRTGIPGGYAMLRAYDPTNQLMGGSGVMSQIQESTANNSALGHLDKAQDRREYRRRTYPGRGTYAAAGALGLGMTFSPDIRESIIRFVNDNPTWNLPALGLGVMGAGALGGRAFAETRNLFDRKDKKPSHAAI